jgi:hypothetical protein
MKKSKFAHNYSASEPEITRAADEYVTKAQKRRRMYASRPPVPDDLPEGVEVPADRQGVVATFFRKV